MINFKCFVPALCAGAMAIVPNTVSAADPGASDDWQLKAGMVQVIYFNLTAEGLIYLITLYKKSERDTIGAGGIKRATP